MSQIETQQPDLFRLLSADVRGEDRSKGGIYPHAKAYGEAKSPWLVRARGANLKILQGTRLSQPAKTPSAGNHNIEDTWGEYERATLSRTRNSLPAGYAASS